MIIVRLLGTAVLVLAAVFGVAWMWDSWFQFPWTRDGVVQADVVRIASPVPGRITLVGPGPSDEVAAGDLLFRLDRTDYRLAVERAEAAVSEAQARYDRDREAAARLQARQRDEPSPSSEADATDARLRAASAKAALAVAETRLRSARTDLDRTEITAPVAGHVASVAVNEGEFVEAHEPLAALIEAGSFRVDAFFMETKLPRIRVGSPARIRLMASGAELRGTVQGIARGIRRGDPSGDPSALLASPAPSFQWIRLAQRIPVSIAIETEPDDVPLIVGETATVIVEPPDADDGFWSGVGRSATRLVAGFY